MPSYGKTSVWTFAVAEVWNGPTANVRGWDGATPAPSSQPAAVRQGDVISVAGLGPYQITEDLLGAGAKPHGIEKGDRLVLFLSRRGDRFPGPSVYGATSAEWAVSDNALRFVDAARQTYAFVQYFPPRAMGSRRITATAATFPGLRPLALAALRERVRASIDEAAGTDELIARATRADLPKLFAPCRAATRPAADEVIAPRHWQREASAAISRLADAETIVNFFERPDLAEEAGYFPNYVLTGRADCRERMLQLVEGNLLTPERREMAGFVLRDPGQAYRVDLSHAEERHAPLPSGGAFARRLAKVAVTTADPKAALPLYRGVRDCIEYIDSPRPPALAADLAAAADVLVAAWPKLESDAKWEAWGTLDRIDPRQAQRVMPGGGPFLTMIGPSPDWPGAAAGQIAVRYCYRNTLAKSDPAAKLSIVYRPTAGAGGEAEQPFDADQPQRRPNDPRGNFGAWSGLIWLPPGLAPGEYDVFLRTRRGDATIGEGLGWRMTVP